jgi:hypothetical protein
VRFGPLTKIRRTVLWDVIPCSLVVTDILEKPHVCIFSVEGPHPWIHQPSVILKFTTVRTYLEWNKRIRIFIYLEFLLGWKHVFSMKMFFLVFIVFLRLILRHQNYDFTCYSARVWRKCLKDVKGKAVSVLNWLSTLPWRCMGEWRYSSIILELDTSWKWVVSFTTLPLYPRGKNPRYLLERRLGGPQSGSGRRGEQKILDPSGTLTPTPLSSSP